MLKNISLVIFFFSPIFLFSSTSENDSIFGELEKTIANRRFYMDQKENHINNLKATLKQNEDDLEKQYYINLSLYNEYNKYILDSAIVYTKNNLKIAELLDKNDLINESKLNLASLYAFAAMYIEALKLLQTIDSSVLPQNLKADYYDAYRRFYHYYSISNKIEEYNHTSELYRDSLLNVLDKQSFRYKTSLAEAHLWNRNFEEVSSILSGILPDPQNDNKEKALVYYLLASNYRQKNDYENQKKYFAMSAIADIKNAIKENASLQSLALALYETGDFEEANELIRYAKEDADFSNTRFRYVRLSEVQPAINQAYEATIKKQNLSLQNSLILISVLSIVLILVAVYLYYQIRRLARIRKQLHNSNLNLSEVNKQLNDVNTSLTEANQIKVAYIMQFLDASSNYIENMESFMKRVHKMFTTKKYNELGQALNSSDEIIDSELLKLHYNFDDAFLHFYPNFVEQFNNLLLPEEQIVLKEGELLTPELRVFALIRLGITDASKTAGFLRYSVSTIYNYRNKVRNKLAVPREKFDEFISQIGG